MRRRAFQTAREGSATFGPILACTTVRRKPGLRNVGLERRGGKLYYYRSVRDGEKVRKVYVGAGETARVSHEEDVLWRTSRKARREREKEDLERVEAVAARSWRCPRRRKSSPVPAS